MDSNIDFSKCSSQVFNEFLDKGVENIDENSIANFFNACINFLNRDDSSIAFKYKIIYSLERSLSSQAKIETFINGNYLSQLPFKLFNAQEKILDIIYIITNYAPSGITDNVAFKFGKLITRYPRKCLNILSLFAERFQVTFNPWKMIDRLFVYCDTFIDQTCVDDYISTLSYLNENFQSFRENRIKHTWTAYCQVIKKCSIDSSKAKTYYAMCQLYELRPRIIKRCPFPETAPDDLLNPTLQKAVISLLLRLSPNQVEEPTIKSLLKIKNESSLYALLLLTENQECAKVLSYDLNWLQDEIPTSEGTMQVFAKLLNSPYVKYDLIKSPEVVTYLNSIINNGNNPENSSLTTASTFVRSLPINGRFVGYISNEGFLSNYFKAALPRTEESVVDSNLLLIEAVSKQSDAVEYSDLCNYVKEKTLQNNPVASRAAVNLARYPRCSKEFKKNGLVSYFEKNPNVPGSSNFLSNYKKSVNLSVRAPPVVSSLPSKKPLSKPPQVKSSDSESKVKQSPIRKQQQQQDKKEIKSRSIVLPNPVPEPEKESEYESESEPKKPVESKKQIESKKPVESKKDSESEDEDEKQTKYESEKKSKLESKTEPEKKQSKESEDEDESELETKSGSESGPIQNSNLSENSSDDSIVLKKSNSGKSSGVPTPKQSPSSVHTSVISSPSASGVYDPYISPSRKVANSPIANSKFEIEEEEESESTERNANIQSSKSDFNESNEKLNSSILKGHANNSDDSASETENINPSISPIKQKSAVPASPLNKSKIRGIASFGSFGSISDGDEIKKSPSKISVDLPPPEQYTQNLLPDAIGGLTYIKQGSPPPKPRPSRNKE